MKTRQIVTTAVTQNGSAVKCASRELKNNEQIVADAVVTQNEET